MTKAAQIVRKKRARLQFRAFSNEKAARAYMEERDKGLGYMTQKRNPSRLIERTDEEGTLWLVWFVI